MEGAEMRRTEEDGSLRQREFERYIGREREIEKGRERVFHIR